MMRRNSCRQSIVCYSVKSQYPNEKANVESRQQEIRQMWQRCEAQAAERRSLLQSAVGHQIFANSSAQLVDWLQVSHVNVGQVLYLCKCLLVRYEVRRDVV